MRLFVTRKLPVDVGAVVGPGVEVSVFPEDRAPTRDELIAGARGAQGLVTLLSDAVDGALLDALPEVRVVSNYAVGLDNVDLRACAARGVVVTHTPDVNHDATADLTWALILAAARRVLEGDRLVRSGGFTTWSPTMLLGKELRGATLGVFGFGRIGQEVARRALGFGMQVLFTSRSQVPQSVQRALRAQPVPLDELVERADVLTVHCPLTAHTRHALDAGRLSRMKPDAILVNTARGPIVDEAALAQALSLGRPGAAALDVYEREPLVHEALLARDDVVLLPHLGSATGHTRRRMAEIALGDASRVVRGERPLCPVAPSLHGGTAG